jgi:hypothetical protein
MDMHRDLKIKNGYFSYLLRIWQLEKGEKTASSKESIWRVSLESTLTRHRVNFASLEEMLIFLQDQFELGDESSDESERNQ